ncbi:MAG: IS200/IS605 family transposase, partial [Phycisphaerales bacterium]|nr:IS200/IS605 family transposase [Phycisphaerales bacterium]
MAHTHTRRLVHVVFSTKGREPTLTPPMLDRLFPHIVGVVQQKGGEVIRAGGVADHVHLHIAMPATRSVSELVRDMKSNSSRWIREIFPEGAPFAWQSGYGAFLLSDASVESVARYIANQAQHHRAVSFQEEYLDFLQRNGVDDDPKWVFADEPVSPLRGSLPFVPHTRGWRPGLRCAGPPGLSRRAHSPTSPASLTPLLPLH